MSNQSIRYLRLQRLSKVFGRKVGFWVATHLVIVQWPNLARCHHAVALWRNLHPQLHLDQSLTTEEMAGNWRAAEVCHFDILPPMQSHTQTRRYSLRAKVSLPEKLVHMGSGRALRSALNTGCLLHHRGNGGSGALPIWPPWWPTFADWDPLVTSNQRENATLERPAARLHQYFLSFPDAVKSHRVVNTGPPACAKFSKTISRFSGAIPMPSSSTSKVNHSRSAGFRSNAPECSAALDGQGELKGEASEGSLVRKEKAGEKSLPLSEDFRTASTASAAESWRGSDEELSQPLGERQRDLMSGAKLSRKSLDGVSDH